MGFQQGLSGLNAASKNLDVIGHNIANSNTTGFKASRADFAEMVASAIGSASGQSSGIGVNVAAVSQQFKQGSITSTGNSLDIAINGNGFFVVQQSDGSIAYTRAGNFGLDKAGNLKTVDNDNVMGYVVDPTTGKIQSGATPVPLSFPTGQPIPAKQTTSVNVELNLDARATAAAGDPAATPPVAATPRATYGTSLNVYDTQGTAIPVNLYFEKSATGNTWDIYNSLDSTATPIGTATFDASGKLTSISPSTTPGGTSLTLSVSGGTANPNGLPPFNVEMDFGGLTQFGTKFAVSSLKQDGYTSGALTGINVGKDGSIVASYSNGVTRTEGQLALAAFTNTQGLGSVGNNKWVQTADSGPALNGSAQTGTFGSLQSGALEESNVDLTAELVNMMTAQRSYQANAQTIKTQDQVFSTLVNLR
ncbi:flagellar hook protein FlgE [Comamonas testosteroni]|uniref:Flagellar hook protein FlgE n=1 Tax=Comamonas testosteroni TaxID=285 RepID=A0A373FGJ8_COMTE|nr:flagellar hook protein FlgE [Comamonas testosteroni]RGE43243.1 flagellar hook protein FlgE [Comamonas testosteroni]